MWTSELFVGVLLSLFVVSLPMTRVLENLRVWSVGAGLASEINYQNAIPGRLENGRSYFSRLLNGAPPRIFGLLLRLEQFSFLSWDERTCVARSPLRG
jgi:hypothetical protein